MLNEQMTQCQLQMKALLVFIDVLREGFKTAYSTILRIRYVKLYAEENVIQVNELELIGCHMMGIVTNVPTRTVRTAFFATPMGLDYLSVLERNNLGGEGFATFCHCHRFGMLPPNLNMQQLY